MSAILGGVLLTVASAVGMLIAFIPAFMLLGASGSQETSDADRAILGRLGIAWLLAVGVTTSSWIVGSWLLRRRRGMVLWLRRFRDPAGSAVVEAALDHIGRSWRVVTLDDSMAQPVGVAPILRLSTRLLTWLKRVGARAGPVMSRAGRLIAQLSVAGIVVTVIWSVYQGTGLELLESFPTVASNDLIEARIVTGLLAVLVLEFAILILWLGVLLVALALTGVWSLAGGVGKEIRRAEDEKRWTVGAGQQAVELAKSIDAASTRVIAPRLTVLGVDDSVWRETVATFVERADAVLIDVSDVSDNVRWEVDQVDRLAGSRAVFVADRDTVDAAGLSSLLEGHDLLVYTTGFWGRLRFQRALFGALEDTLVAVPFTRQRLGVAVRVSLAAALLAVSAWALAGFVASLI